MTAAKKGEVPSAARERILEAGLTAFALSGFDGTSTREIALAAGVQQGLLAYHFQSKEGLWQAVVDDGFARLAAAAELAAQTAPISVVEPQQRLRAQLQRALELGAAQPRLVRLLCHAALNGGPRLDWLSARHLAPLQAEWRRALAALPSTAVSSGLEVQLLGWLVAEVVLAPVFGSEVGAMAPVALAERLDAWLGEPRAAAGAWSLAAARRRAAARSEVGP